MPKSTREWSRRKLDESINCIDWAGKHLVEVADNYNYYHPEISKPMFLAASSLIEIQKAILRIKDSY